MLTAVVTFSGSTFDVALQGASFVTAEEGEEAAGPESDLNPIAPELKEIVWGFGAFVVLALALRLFLFRKVRDGMTSRYGRIEGDLEQAEALTASARADVAEYDAQVATVRAEAQTRVERGPGHARSRARREARRSERSHRREACCGRSRGGGRQAGGRRGQVESAVADVSARLGELATGRRPSDDVVRAAVAQAMGQEVSA